MTYEDWGSRIPVPSSIKRLLDGVATLRNNGVMPTEDDGTYRITMSRNDYDCLLSDCAFHAMMPEGMKVEKIAGATIYIQLADGTLVKP